MGTYTCENSLSCTRIIFVISPSSLKDFCWWWWLIGVFCLFFETEFHSEAYIELKLMAVLLLQPPKCWGYRHAPPHPVYSVLEVESGRPVHGAGPTSYSMSYLSTREFSFLNHHGLCYDKACRLTLENR